MLKPKEKKVSETDIAKIVEALKKNGNGNTLNINPAKTNILIGFKDILVAALVILGITIPLWIKVSAYQNQNYAYQVVSAATYQKQLCVLVWDMKNRPNKYDGECDHITIPAIPLVPP